METTVLKAIAIVGSLLASLMGGYLPIWYQQQQRGQVWLTRGYFFAKGIFLGAAILHLLPAANEEFAKVFPDLHYPVMGLVALLTIFLLQAIEHLSATMLGRFNQLSNHITIYILIFTLSIHSIIEGAALGIGVGFAEMTVILTAVLAHKGADAFALVINMQRRGYPYKKVYPLMLVFACMTPLGIVLGSVLHSFTADMNGSALLATIDAVTAGTFISIANTPVEQEEMTSLAEKKSILPIEMLSIGIGISIMAIVAIWI